MMDLGAVLAELKAVDDFKQTDKNLATASFCQRACKVLDKVVKAAGDVEYDHLVIGIWIVIGSFNEVLPQLVDGPSLTEFVDKLFRQCARVVLDIKWQQLDEDEKCRQNFQSSLLTCHQQMAPRGFSRFGVLQALMDNPWTDPVLTMVMGSEDDNEEGEGLTYIKAQDPEILKLRVELMQQENCDEFALNLCTWCLKHPALAGDFNLRRTQFVLLHRLSYTDKLQEECQTIGVGDSIGLINSLQEKEEHKELCIRLAQTFLVQNWIRTDSNSEVNKELLRLWIRLQYQADGDQDRFISSLWAVAKVSHSTKQLLFIIDAVREQCGDTFLQFYTDLCVFAINVDKGCWEKLKESSTLGPNEEILARKRDMARVCDKLAHIISHVSPKTSFCCALTAFAMQPTEPSLQKVRDAYQRKSKAGMSMKLHFKCCSNCASEQGQCMKNSDSDKASRDINIATLYEVERLCGMLRPAYLSSDSDFSILFTMCKQYLMKENGEAVQSALVRRKSLSSTPPVAVPSIASSSQYTASVVGSSAQVSKPNILRGSATASKTVDIASHVNNIAMPEKAAAMHSMVGIHGSVLAPGAQQKTPASVLPSMQTGLPPVKRESQQPGRSGIQPGQQASGQNIIQQLVLQQLSSDTVQALLHLIQSGQISPMQLNHIMTKNPNMSVQVLQNLVSQAKQAQKYAAPKQAQQQQLHQIQQQQQQQQACQKQQTQQQQQRPAQPSYGVPQVLQSTNAQQSRQAVQHQMGLRQQTPQQVRAQQPPAQPAVLPRMMGGQMVLQQSVSMQQPSVRPRLQQQPQASPQTQQQQMLQGMQQIRPPLPSIPALRLSSTGEIHVTQPLHIMTLRHSAPMQSYATGSQSQPILIQTSTHLSGGTVSVQQQPRILHLPSASVTSKLIPKAPGPGIAVQGISLGPTLSQAQASTSDAAVGNRHYSINNLLFTGEQQNSTLSITLPDTLPEISVDSVSDTLRALSDPPTGSGHVIRKEPTQQAQMPVTQAVSHTVSQVSAAQGPVNASQALQRQPPSKAPKQQAPKKPARKQAPKAVTSQAQVSAPAAVATPPQPSNPLVSIPSLTQPQQNTQPYGQPLPSFSSLFTPNREPLPVPKPVSSTAPAVSSTSPASDVAAPAAAASSPTSPSKKGVAGQGKGQKKATGGEKAGNKGLKKDKEMQAAEKEAMMRLLKQVMTIDIEKNDGEDAGPSYLHIPGQPVTSSHPAVSPLAAGPKSVVPPQGASAPGLKLPSSLARPLFQQQSPQSSHESPSAAVPEQLASVAQQSVALHASVQTTTPADQTAAHMPSLAMPSTVSTAPFSGPAAMRSQPFPPFTPSNYSSPKLHDVVSNTQAGAQEVAATPMTGMMNSPLPSAGATASPATASVGQIGGPSVSYGPSAHLPGLTAPTSFMNTAAAASVGSAGAGSLKTYSKLDSPLSKSPRQDPLEPVVSIPIPTSILPEGGIMETGRDGDQSIATYRCIICAKAFMTLDALRVHVKQICKPGLSQPGGLSNRMAINKAQATEAGLETSTVFQCMRCFELCISEAGIRDHKLVCSKAPKPSKSKTKSRAKPKPPKSEEEQATEAKVMELLNKCLGENREKLLEETKALAAKQASAKKRPAKKRLSTEGEPPAVPGVTPADAAPVPKKARKTPPTLDTASSGTVVQGTAPRPAVAVGPESAATTTVTTCACGTALGLAKTEVLAEPIAPFPGAVTSSAPSEYASKLASTCTCSQAPAPTVATPVVAVSPIKIESTPTSAGDAKEVKPKPKRKYYPRKKKPTENAAEGNMQLDTTIKKAGQSESAGKTSKLKKSEGSGTKPVKEKKPKKEPGPPPPRYKEVIGSGGRSFFKCTNCGQTLCSVESFGEHWLECIVKKPLPVKPKRAPKAKKPKAESGGSNKSENTTYSSRESIETTIESVASASYTSDAFETEPITAPASKDAKDGEAENTDISTNKEIESSLNNTVEEEEEGSSQATNSSSGTSVHTKAADSEENSVTSNAESGGEAVVAEEVPVVFEADAGVVIPELQVETTVEVTTSSFPQIRQPVVVLEKASLPENVGGKSPEDGSADGETEISELSRAEKSSEKVAESSPAPTASPRGLASKMSASQLRKIRNRRRSRPAQSGSALKRRERMAPKDESSPTNVAGKPPSGDSKYCGLCKRYFSRRVILIQHIASKHVQPYTLKRLGDSSSYFCHLCQKVFPQFSQYMAHVSCHSQAIVKKFSEMESLNKLGSPCRSRRIASQKGAAGRNLKKQGRTSPRDLGKAGDDDGTDAMERRVRGRLRKLTSPVTASTSAADEDEAAPTPVNDRRSSGRAAQKQALSKIFISSLGIVENTKRKLSSDEKSSVEAKPKRVRQEKSTKEEADSEEDEGKAEQSSGEADDKDEASAMKAGSGQVSTTSPTTTTATTSTTTITTTSQGSTPAEKASMDASAAQSLANHGPGKSILSVHCPQSGPLPVNSPPVSSSLTMAPKMPTFLDSFLNFCSSRSPEAPLPLSQSKRRFSYLNTCLEKESFTGAPSSSRRSSCDGLTRPAAPTPTFQTTTTLAASAIKPLQCSVNITDVLKTPSAKSPPSANVVNIAARRKSAEYDNVYYYGKFEEQLTKQCKVVLGDRIHKEPVEEPVISVKQCSVNLGPKVNPADVVAVARCTADQAKRDTDNDVKKAETSEVPESVPAALHEVTGDGSPRKGTNTVSAPQSAPPSVCDLGDSFSQGNPPQLQGGILSSQANVPQSDEVCVEATLSLLPVPEMFTADADVMALVSSMASQIEEQNRVAPLVKSVEFSNPTEEVVNVSTMSLSAAEATSAALPQLLSEGAQQPVSISQSVDSSSVTPRSESGQPVVVLDVNKTVDGNLETRDSKLEVEMNKPVSEAGKSAADDDTCVDNGKQVEDYKPDGSGAKQEIPVDTSDAVVDIPVDDTDETVHRDQPLPERESLSQSPSYDKADGSSDITENTYTDFTVHGLINRSIDMALLQEYSYDAVSSSSSSLPSENVMDITDATSVSKAANEPALTVELLAATRSADQDNTSTSTKAELKVVPAEKQLQSHETVSVGVELPLVPEDLEAVALPNPEMNHVHESLREKAPQAPKTTQLFTSSAQHIAQQSACGDVVINTTSVELPGSSSPPAAAGPDQSTQVSYKTGFVGLSDKIDSETPEARETVDDTRYAESEDVQAASMALDAYKTSTVQLDSAEGSEREFSESVSSGNAEHTDSWWTEAAEVSTTVDSEEQPPAVITDKPLCGPVLALESSVPASPEGATKEAEETEHTDEAQNWDFQDASCLGGHLEGRYPASSKLSGGPKSILLDVPQEQKEERREISEEPLLSSGPSEDAERENEHRAQNNTENNTIPEAEIPDLPKRAHCEPSESLTAAKREAAAQDCPHQLEASPGSEHQREGQGEKCGLSEAELTGTDENEDRMMKSFDEAGQETSDSVDEELQSVEAAPPPGTGNKPDVTDQNVQQVHDHFKDLQEKNEVAPSLSLAGDETHQESAPQRAPSVHGQNRGSMSMMDFLQKSAFTVLQGSSAQEVSEARMESQEPSSTAADRQEAEEMTWYDAETDVDDDDTEDDWDTGNDRVNIITLPEDNQPAATSGAALSPSVKTDKSSEPGTTAQLDADEQLTPDELASNAAESGESQKSAEISSCKLVLSTVFSDPEPQPTAAAEEVTVTQSPDGVQELSNRLPYDSQGSVGQVPGDLQGPVQQLLSYLQESDGKSVELAEERGLLALPGPVPCEDAVHASDSVEDEDKKHATLSAERLEETTSAMVSACPLNTVAAASSSNSAEPEKSSDETDPDYDLPELCIVPDSQVIVLRGVDRRPEKTKTVSPASDEDGPETVLSAVVDDHEVKIKNLKVSRPRTRRSTTFVKDTYIARVETKEEKVVEEAKEDDEMRSAESLRKPLLGLKSLRSMHKPEPFVWEVDGEEDSRKQARNERSLRAFRQKAQVAPFSWDSDGTDQDKNWAGEKGATEGEASVPGEQPLQPFREKVDTAPSSRNSDKADCKGSAGKDLKEVKQESRTSEKDSDEAEDQNTSKKGSDVADSASTIDKDSEEAEGTASASKNCGEADHKRSADEGGSSEAERTSRTNRRDSDQVDQVDDKTEPSVQATARRNKHVKDKDSSGADKTGTVPLAETPSPSTERGRLMTRSRDLHQSGSSDRSVLQTPTRSVSRNRRNASASKEKPLRKSRSCDIEGSDVVPQFSVEPSTPSKTLLLQETVTDCKVQSDSATKDSSGTGTPSNRKSGRESANPQPENLQSKVNTRSSEKVVQSPSLRKWRGRRLLCSSADNKTESLDAKTDKNSSSRPKIKRSFNAESPNTGSTIIKTDKTASARPKIKQEVNAESEQKKTADGGSISTRSRHSSKNSKLERKLSSALKSLRSRDTSVNKCAESQSFESLQESVKSLRKRTSSNSSSTPAKSLRRGDNTSGVSLKKTGERKANMTYARESTPTPSTTTESVSEVETPSSTRVSLKKTGERKVSVTSAREPTPTPSTTTESVSEGETSSSTRVSLKKTGERKANMTSAREPTPTPSTTTESVSEVGTPSNARAQRSKDRKVMQPSSPRKIPQAVSPPQLNKPDPVINLDLTTVSSVKTDRHAAPAYSSLPTDKTGNSDLMQTPTLQPTTKEQESNSEPKYLGAMVRRRQQPVSWRTTLSHPAKRLRMPCPKALQYEIIRVEPVRADSPTDHRRTRSSDKDVEPPPRTVHTRVTVDDLKPPVHCAESGKTGSDQKWLINRHIAPAGLKKRNTDVHFPFSFQRARTRTQTK